MEQILNHSHDRKQHTCRKRRRYNLSNKMSAYREFSNDRGGSKSREIFHRNAYKRLQFRTSMSPRTPFSTGFDRTESNRQFHSFQLKR